MKANGFHRFRLGLKVSVADTVAVAVVAAASFGINSHTSIDYKF
jgi:hypothetical protein